MPLNINYHYSGEDQDVVLNEISACDGCGGIFVGGTLTLVYDPTNSPRAVTEFQKRYAYLCRRCEADAKCS